MNRKAKAEGVRKAWDKYKFVALVVLAGAVLLLWPSGTRGTAAAGGQTGTALPAGAAGAPARL